MNKLFYLLTVTALFTVPSVVHAEGTEPTENEIQSYTAHSKDLDKEKDDKSKDVSIIKIDGVDYIRTELYKEGTTAVSVPKLSDTDIKREVSALERSIIGLSRDTVSDLLLKQTTKPNSERDVITKAKVKVLTKELDKTDTKRFISADLPTAIYLGILIVCLVLILIRFLWGIFFD